MKKAKNHITKNIILVTIILLSITNVLLSVVLLHNSRVTSTNLIHERMLDIANCAAASVNGDNLKLLNKNSVGTSEYQDVYNSLAVFRDNINSKHLKYIYCVYQGDDGNFYFALDPDVEEPASYGDPVEHGDGIGKAIKGTPSVDAEPYNDRWGNFFSAYSPVRDSNGSIVGLVMVDFDANWYSNQITSDMGAIVIVFIISLLINTAALILSTNKLRDSLSRLYTEMDILTDDISDLTNSDLSEEENAPNQIKNSDEISETIFRIRTLQKKIRLYISKMKSQAFTDAMTGVGNRAAFAGRTEELNKNIEDGTADFAIAIFDINGLKQINDEHGHDAGDSIIINAANVLKEIFGTENVYRIGGDEFIAILKHATVDEMDGMFERIDRDLDDFNRLPAQRDVKLYISKGTVAFRKGLDSHFNDVFKRADDAMYHDKAAFYLKSGDRRKVDYKVYLKQGGPDADNKNN